MAVHSAVTISPELSASINGLRTHSRSAKHQGRHPEALFPVSGRVLARTRSRRRVSARVLQVDGRGGLAGIAMPTEFGGSGLGITEAAVMMQAIAESGACMSGASSVHMPVFSLQPIVLFATPQQKERMLPPV